MSESGYTLSPLCQSQLFPLCPPLNITLNTKKSKHKQMSEKKTKREKQRERERSSFRQKKIQVFDGAKVERSRRKMLKLPLIPTKKLGLRDA